MLSLEAKIRKEVGKKVKTLRKKGVLPAVLYGPKIHPVKPPVKSLQGKFNRGIPPKAELFNRVKSLPLEIDLKEFEKIYQEAGESTLIKLKVKSQKLKVDEFLVLIHDIQFDPLTEKPIHVDFYQPSLKEEIEARVPLIFEGEAPAVKELGGTLVKSISELEVKALPQNLPHEIKVDVSQLTTFEAHILIKDLKLPEGVKISRAPEEILVFVAPPEKVEEELVKPVEEKVEEVGKVEEKKVEEKEIK